MNKVGIHIGYWLVNWDFDVKEGVRRAADAGFDAIEIMGDSLLGKSEQECKDLASYAADKGIELLGSLGMPAEMDITSDDPAVKAYGMKCMREIIEKLGLMGIKGIAGVLYSAWSKKVDGPITPAVKAKVTDDCVAAMKELAKVAEDNDVLLGFEVVNRFEHFIANTCEEGLAVIKRIDSPKVKLHLDTFHMNIDETSMVDAIKLAGDELGHFHVGENNRRLPGLGSMNWAPIFEALKSINYQGPIDMEPFVRYGGEVASAVSLWRDLTGGASEEELDAQAKKAAEFVRSFL